jgi:hypothetical protein
MSLIRGRNESLGDGSRGTISSKQLNKYNRVIHYGRVFEVSDDNNMKLKVFVRGIDKPDVTKDDLPWSEPFLPRMFNVVPQVGETVKVILMDTNNPYQEREWVGPIISQPEKIKKDPHFFTSLAGKAGGLMKLGRSIKTIPEAQGIYPDPDDVSILGRDNSDIQLKENEVLIRAGKHVIDKPLKLNEKNPAYINMRVLKPSDFKSGKNVTPTEKELNLTEDRTDTVITSNKIFLIGRDSNSSVIKPILSKDDHLTLEDKLHPAVYGDVLYDFMVILRQWIKGHIHVGDRREPDPSGSTVKIEEWFIKNLDDRLLSRNIYMGGDVPVETNPSKDKN